MGRGALGPPVIRGSVLDTGVLGRRAAGPYWGPSVMGPGPLGDGGDSGAGAMTSLGPAGGRGAPLGGRRGQGPSASWSRRAAEGQPEETNEKAKHSSLQDPARAQARPPGAERSHHDAATARRSQWAGGRCVYGTSGGTTVFFLTAVCHLHCHDGLGPGPGWGEGPAKARARPAQSQGPPGPDGLGGWAEKLRSAQGPGPAQFCRLPTDRSHASADAYFATAPIWHIAH